MSATTASHCWPRLSIQRCTHKFSSLAFLIVEESKKPAQACLKPYKRKLSVGAPRVVIVGRASVEVDVAAAECQRVPLPASGNIRATCWKFRHLLSYHHHVPPSPPPDADTRSTRSCIHPPPYCRFPCSHSLMPRQRQGAGRQV